MAFFTSPQDTTIINHEIESLQKYLRQLLADKDVLTEDLRGYDSPEYEHFKNNVLGKEMIRIAMVRMTKPADKIYLHDALQGQYNECELLMRKKEDIERDISVIRQKISESNSKIDRMKKQLNARIPKEN